MTSAKVTSKGQITIPVDVRNRLGLRAGSRLAFVLTESGGYEIRAESGSIRNLKGVLPRPALPVSVDDMDAAIAAGGGGVRAVIGLDTNVVVRYVVQDDPEQAARASETIEAFTEAEPGFVSLVTVVELWWVLRRAYRVDTAECGDVIEGLLDARELRVGQDSAVRAAVAAIRRDGADFADVVIAELGREAGCRTTMTFDRRAAASGSMQLLAP